MGNLWRDLRFAFRGLRKNRGFAASTILTLALGIGANTAIFSIVYGTLFAPMPYPKSDQVVVIWSKINGKHNSVAAGDYLDWKTQSSAFQQMTAFTFASFNLSVSSIPEQVRGELVSPGSFSKTFGIGPSLGRDFSSEESEPGNDHVVILSHRLWERRFGSDPRVLGRQLRINGETYAIIGILPAGSYDRLPAELFAPLAFKPEQINHDFHWMLVLGRLKSGVSLSQAQADMDVVTHNVASAYPKTNKSWGASVEPLHNDFLNRDTRRSLWLLFGAVGLVLLMACVNVANLLLARGISRQKEIAVRASLGATRKQLFDQFIAESLLLAVLGGTLGVGLGWAILKALMVSMPPFWLPSEADIKVNLPVLGFTLAITIFSGVLFGCAPAWQAAYLNLNEVLKEGGRTSMASGRHRVRRVLVVIEFALAVTLLTSAGLLIHSFWNLRHADLGIRADHILTFSLPVPSNRFAQPPQLVAFYKDLISKIKTLPGISSVSASVGRPIQGTGFGMPFSIVGKADTDISARPGAGFQMVTPEYYRTFGIKLEKGRSFTEQDISESLPVAMVNENFVKRFLSGLDPLTQRVAVEQLIPGVTRLGPPIDYQIVGVFHNVRYGGASNHEDSPEIDIPFWQTPWPQTDMAVRTIGDPESVRKSIALAVQSIDPDLPMADVKTMVQVIDESLSGDRLELVLLACFSAVALLLATIGVYGAMAYYVAQQTHDIGMRMALGAGPSQVLRFILRQGMVLALTGFTLGLAGAFSAAQIIRSQLYGVGNIDPGSLFAVVILLLAAVFFACYIPAHRAMRIDPMVALRYE